jgi:hypothetical protein
MHEVFPFHSYYSAGDVNHEQLPVNKNNSNGHCQKRYNQGDDTRG